MVDGFGIRTFNNRLRGHTAKEGNFLPQMQGEGFFGAANKHTGLNTHFPQFVDGVLRGFGFKLLRHGNIGD